MPTLFHVTPRSASSLGDEVTFARQVPADNADHAKTQSKPEPKDHNFPLIFRCSGQYLLQYSDSISLRISPAAR